MDSNSVSPLPDTLAPIAEFDKSSPSPQEVIPMDDLPPPPKCHNNCDQYGVTNWGCLRWCEYITLIVLFLLLVVGLVCLMGFWVFQYHEGVTINFNKDPNLAFAFHPFFMIVGLIAFNGLALVMYRFCRCSRRIWAKLLHMIFHAIGLAFGIYGYIFAWKWCHADLNYTTKEKTPIVHYFSLHSIIGIITLFCFIAQFIVGFFTFLILLCCEVSTACCRAKMVPIHVSFGFATWILAIGSCMTGFAMRIAQTNSDLTNRAKPLTNEEIVLNTAGTALAALMILIAYLLLQDRFRFKGRTAIRSSEDI